MLSIKDAASCLSVSISFIIMSALQSVTSMSIIKKTCTLRAKKSPLILIGQQNRTNEISTRVFTLPVRERVWDATRVSVELEILFKFAPGTLMLTCTSRENNPP